MIGTVDATEVTGRDARVGGASSSYGDETPSAPTSEELMRGGKTDGSVVRRDGPTLDPVSTPPSTPLKQARVPSRTSARNSFLKRSTVPRSNAHQVRV